ncbi:type IV pilus modification protein PilV [Shewanella youngdeokensis]|uniref:Type IV pilus modification protein PilV n=1 Tax=Shewanella youngdeokensis TaxID=2999068 RepID=A0ABZ0JVU3_9GAMM|nr:type IV pilus modification protein PilV [Shewanella sp. DAU334]
MKNQQQGLSLIELMVSLVILVVGLIGIFNLHLVAKRGSFESFQQTQASYLINDIVNRMRLNRSLLASYSGTYTGTLTQPKSCDVAVGANVTCSANETLAWDLYQWESRFTELDDATACVLATANGNVEVVMSWRGIRELSDGGAATGKSSLAKGCGTANKRRRIYSLQTVII